MTARATPVLLAWSGGKDSTLALERLLGDPRWRVAGLVTTVTTGYDRIAIHGVRRSILRRQVDGLGLPLFEAEIPPAADNDDLRTRVRRCARERARALQDRSTRSHSAICSSPTCARIATRCSRGSAGTVCYPLWREDTTALARRFIDRGYRAILSCVDTQQLDAAFCGREFDASLLADLPSAWIPAAKTASSTPASMRGRCGARRLRSNAASACCATNASSTSI